MARDPASSSLPQGWSAPKPWPLLLAGLVISLVAVGFSFTDLHAPRLILLAVGTLVAAYAVVRELKVVGWEFEDRVETAAFLALASFVGLLGYLAMEDAWDSGKTFFAALVAVSLVGAVLVLLPSAARKVILLLLVAFHFGGMLTAVTSVAPPNGSAPWVSTQMWRVYRPYLTMTYLANAYHFYSPDPGPATLVWFRVQYEDGTYRWVRVPDRSTSPTRMHYQRLLAMTESTNNHMPRLPMSEAERALLISQGQQVQGYSWQEIERRRILGSTFAEPEELPQPRELEYLNLPISFQYREPQELARRLIASYARHVAQTTPHSEDPNIPVKSVKVYRLIHNLLTPAELASGQDPYQETRYLPYFQGEFLPDGTQINLTDPFLYWYVPIVVVHKDWPKKRLLLPVNDPPPHGRILNGLAIHSGDIVTASDQEQKIQ